MNSHEGFYLFVWVVSTQGGANDCCGWFESLKQAQGYFDEYWRREWELGHKPEPAAHVAVHDEADGLRIISEFKGRRWRRRD